MHYQQIKTELEKLISFPSVSNRPTEAVIAYLAEILENLGFDINYYYDANDTTKANLFASIGPKDSDGLLLSGHIDVVPTDGQSWHSDPFKLLEKDHCFFARGSVDMKGFIAVVISVLKSIKLTQIKKELVLLWTYDEEIGCIGSRTFVQSFHKDNQNQRYLPKFCIIGEPTKQQMIIQHSGIFLFDILLKGKAAHSSLPSLGISAISDANKIINELEAIADSFRQRSADEIVRKSLAYPYTTINIATITGGITYNIVPEHCKIGVSVRPIPGVSVAEVKAEIFSRLYRLNLKSKIEIIETIAVNGLKTSVDTQCVNWLKPYSVDESPKAVAYCTDGGNLAELDLECVIFGPGSIEQAHKPNEYIQISELITYRDKLEQMIRNRLC
ncbi:acetylornithine deacetylase [Thiotrichales bacterium 19S3-7]|nr:acetylornithine deacetylase [Thiotrichales bacterium 19S3-7]MCF6801747.1 acetylornithine deacetylase [Thiotrichales bacterium 19S3-11]